MERPPLAAVAWALVLGVMWGASGVAPIGAEIYLSAILLFAIARLRSGSRTSALLTVITAVFCGALIAGRSPDLVVGDHVDDGVVDVIEGIVEGPVVSSPTKDSFLLRAGDQLVWTTVHGLSRVEPGDRIVVTGELRRVRGYRVWGTRDRRFAPSGAFIEVAVEPAAVRVVSRQLGLASAAHRSRLELADVIEAAGGSRQGRAVLRAMVLGDRAALDESVAGAFRAAGLSHVLAVSGLHVAAVATTLFFVLRFLIVVVSRTGSGHRLAALLTLPSVLFYALLTGARPSTVRASVVIAAVLIGVALYRRTRVFDALAVAAALIVAVSPLTVFDPSFQLSFAAASALVLCPAWKRESSLSVTGRFIGWARALAWSSMWATIATAPLTASWFGSATPVAPAVNLIAVPLSELVVVPVGLLGLSVNGLWAAGGAVVLRLAISACEFLTALATHVAALCPAMEVAQPSPVVAVTMTLAILVGLAVMGGRVPLVKGAQGIAVLVLVVVTAAGWRGIRRDGGLVVTFIDVGQGDAAVIEFPNGAVWLVDGGGKPFVQSHPGETEKNILRRGAAPGERAVRRYLEHRGIDTLEVVIISHPHPDHFLGVHALVDDFAIEALWLAQGSRRPGGSLTTLLNRLEARGTKVVNPTLDRYYFEGDASIEIVWPVYGQETVASADPILSVNDNSLALILSFAGRHIFFAGDLEEEAEGLVVDRLHSKLAADVVKVPHHGSPTSSTPSFVAATQPALAVISCGAGNRFRFPAAEVVDRWRKGGAIVVRTDENGSIRVHIGLDGAVKVEAHLGLGAEIRKPQHSSTNHR